MSGRLPEPSQAHAVNSVRERGHPQEEERAPFPLDGPAAAGSLEKPPGCQCSGFHEANLLQGTNHSKHVSLDLIPFATRFKHLLIFMCLFRTKIQSSCCSIKDFLPSPLAAICPPQHTLLNHRDDTLSSNNLL